METAELSRRLNNLIRIGTVTETKSAEGKALARVQIGDRVTDFFPVMSFGNSFSRHYIPVRVQEQVMVLSPFGEADSGVILRGIYNKNCKEPDGSNDTTDVIEYEDGTRISYDTEAQEMTVNTPGKITIIAAGSVSVTSESVSVDCTTGTVTAESVTVDSPSIDLGTGGAGVVTGECLCALTGKPHFDFSMNTRSAK